MTAAVTPLEARCEVCLGTGEVRGEGFLDCTSCDVAEQRAELDAWAEKHCADKIPSWDLWLIYQFGKAAAAPVRLFVTCEECDGKGSVVTDEGYPGDGFMQPPDGPNVEVCQVCEGRGAHNLEPISHAAPVVPVAAQPVVQAPIDWKDRLYAAMDAEFALREGPKRDEDGQRMGMVIDDTQVGVEFAMSWFEQNMLAAAPSLEAQPAGEAEEQLRGEGWLAAMDKITALLPGTYYMDPPDGGSVTVLEQVERMAKDAARYRYLRDAKDGLPIELVIKIEEGGAVMDAAIDYAMAQGDKHDN